MGIMISIRAHHGRDLAAQLSRLTAFVLRAEHSPPHRNPTWLGVLAEGLGHTPYCLEATGHGVTSGLLPLCLVESILFGRFLVSLPYVNTSGVLAHDSDTSLSLIDRAVQLADQLKVRYLELRHETPIEHPLLRGRLTSKVHLRLDLPETCELLWKTVSAKVRNQVRKGQRYDFGVAWGGAMLLPEFYAVFSHTMRDLGTPVYGRELFAEVLRQFGEDAELCVVRDAGKAVAGALLLHGRGVTEVPSACALHSYHPSCVNMLMYHHLLERAVQRRQAVFDFGRSTRDSGTFRFKKQWGAKPIEAVWQYYVRRGALNDMRPDNPSYGRLIRIWRQLPVSLTRWIGPPIVRGIP
jgi:FemAB-related protein (PEP-CTERM system-associated)